MMIIMMIIIAIMMICEAAIGRGPPDRGLGLGGLYIYILL